MALERSLIDKYGVDTAGPYYTSYPTLGEWSDSFTEQDFARGLEKFIAEEEDNSFAFYVHYPYCVKLCHFCACNSYVTNRKERKTEALDALIAEMDFLDQFFRSRSFTPSVREIHLGGGSPSYLNMDDFDRLIKRIRATVDLSQVSDFALEVDPRTADPSTMHRYADQGINRISFGIQDFDPRVQEAINRVQPQELVESLLTPEIRKRFRSVNFDILYGLPFQTRESFQRTIEIVKRFAPDRVTLLRYAHLPHVKKHMKLINEAEIVDNEEKTHMFLAAVEQLLGGGYEYIGIDNFAKPHDTLAQAFKHKHVWRNFIGFTPGRVHNMIGVGPSATSVFGDHYSQNVYDLFAYYHAGVGKRFPIERGHVMSQDDIIRREAIFRILCDLSLDWNELGEKFQINPERYFEEEKSVLPRFVEDGLLTSSKDVIQVTPKGRFFIRHIAKVFDVYLRNKAYQIHGT